MKYSQINNIDEIRAEKELLKKQLKRCEKRVDISFIIARRHTRDILSFPLMIKRIISSILSFETLLSQPSLLFKIGSSIGKKIFSKRLK